MIRRIVPLVSRDMCKACDKLVFVTYFSHNFNFKIVGSLLSFTLKQFILAPSVFYSDYWRDQRCRISKESEIVLISWTAVGFCALFILSRSFQNLVSAFTFQAHFAWVYSVHVPFLSIVLREIVSSALYSWK